MITPPTPTTSDTRAPERSPPRMSRPWESVPRGNSENSSGAWLDGLRRASEGSRASASGNQSTTIAPRITTPSHANASTVPSPEIRGRRNRRRAGAAVGAGAGARSATANPRVDERVGDVHEHVDDDVEDGDDDDAADHHRQVVVLHTLHDHAAHPGEVEQPLHHHGPADEAPEADAGEGDDRDRGGPERLGHQD